MHVCADLPTLVVTMFLELFGLGRYLFLRHHLPGNGNRLPSMLLKSVFTIQFCRITFGCFIICLPAMYMGGKSTKANAGLHYQ